MTSSTTSRGAARTALLSLAIGAFGIGMTEFATMGILPQIAGDLLSDTFEASQESAIAQAGHLISLYALGVVIGAPTIAAIVSRFPRHVVMISLVTALLIGNLLTVIAPTYELLAVTRLLSGLPHGAFFGMAAIIASDLMGPERRGRGVAVVMSGLTVANMVGVPAGTFLGQMLGWRATYVVVVVVFAIALIMCWRFIPATPGDPGRSFRKELGVFRLPQVWLTIAFGAIGFGGFFAVYSYVSTFVTEASAAPEWVVPIALVALGLGMFVGNFVGGALADISVPRTLVASLGTLAAASLLVAVASPWTPALIAALFIFGVAGQVVAPTVQLRLLDVAGEYQAIGAALNHSALNIGNGIGAAVGGAAIAAHWGYVSPAWLGAGLALVGIVIAIAALAAERRQLALAA
ncbi:MFS transporter [Microbacterium amylolyticum]|uniref:DHA1 family inner membrane transport protein n=1 Tax=Microbacterium amylolyticum TaxID=936337 RepID=A0ABS4ZGX1_9MICO|nr:MFS transporter [Microbacterium amylolyticum]MBP2436293.1 DHA1 family inner membrane transport protein [Microbacterium amylolyticum]